MKRAKRVGREGGQRVKMVGREGGGREDRAGCRQVLGVVSKQEGVAGGCMCVRGVGGGVGGESVYSKRGKHTSAALRG